RVEGRYRLQFTLANLQGIGTQLITGTTQTLATTQSEVFLVYSAKSFPGLVPFTELSTQGVRMPNRRRREFEGGDKRDGQYSADYDDG
ncbi:hypothetical protein HDU76_007190, partial [Blyttiomyces sp. JEL0837]